MSETGLEASNPAVPSRNRWLWVIAAFVVLAAIGGAVVKMRPARNAQQRAQGQRLQLLADAIQEHARQHDGALPVDLRALQIKDATGQPVDVSTLLTDVATGNPLVYRIVTESGEQLRYNFLGDRIIAWSPEPSYEGKRAVILNGAEIRFASDNRLDLKQQRIDLDTGISAMRPQISPTGEGSDETDDSTEPEDQTPSTSPATSSGG